MESNLRGIANIYSLGGNSKVAKSKLIERIGRHFAEVFDVEYVISPFDTSLIDAVIVREIKFSIVDKDCLLEGRKSKKIDTDNFLNIAKLGTKKEYLADLLLNSKSTYDGLSEHIPRQRKFTTNGRKST